MTTHRIEEAAVSVHRFVTRRVTNHADAADIAQQTLMLGCAKFGTLRGDNVIGWLLVIARHLIVDHYRTRARLCFVTVDRAADEAREPALQVTPDAVLTACDCRERLRVWRQRISLLRLDQQVAVLLADAHEYSDKESAAELRLSVPSFKLLLHGARVRLREVVAEDLTRAGESPLPACDDSGARRGRGADDPDRRAPSAAHPAPHTGVTCRLPKPELLGLRARLLDGLGFGLHVLGCFLPDEFVSLVAVWV